MEWELSGVYRMTPKSPCRVLKMITRDWTNIPKKRQRDKGLKVDFSRNQICECIMNDEEYCTTVKENIGQEEKVMNMEVEIEDEYDKQKEGIDENMDISIPEEELDEQMEQCLRARDPEENREVFKPRKDTTTRRNNQLKVRLNFRVKSKSVKGEKAKTAFLDTWRVVAKNQGDFTPHLNDSNTSTESPRNEPILGRSDVTNEQIKGPGTKVGLAGESGNSNAGNPALENNLASSF